MKEKVKLNKGTEFDHLAKIYHKPTIFRAFLDCAKHCLKILKKTINIKLCAGCTTST